MFSSELESLFWGLDPWSEVPMKGIHLLTQKWSRTLCELDLTNQRFTEEDLEMAMADLAQGTGAGSLRWLNLEGTKITTSALR